MKIGQKSKPEMEIDASRQPERIVTPPVSRTGQDENSGTWEEFLAVYKRNEGAQ